MRRLACFLRQSVQRGCMRNIQKPMQEIVEFLNRPDALQSDSLPQDVLDFDAVPYFMSALPITASVMGVQLLHELSHRAVAYARKARHIYHPPTPNPNQVLTWACCCWLCPGPAAAVLMLKAK